ncbi:TrmH family RNA methyltransferase [Auritidibacter ignavus]|uniref:TrmH family RNA methyltransferase n=2 Tax=Auritidibacter ignavus TaxID=678932 RepID=UPI000F02D01B|nr:RNA methyltransferase [Auritidibacter ignavus]NIH70664.1 tRNA G18 (ribose-2'-O)-methylase SpoU [Auritidibacter ignavus]RMX23208.1 RNA methyltransferase [Auritidibacter ignavus]WGH84363.1 RNA methyltransferase [Auritidibacter ignavus]
MTRYEVTPQDLQHPADTLAVYFNLKDATLRTRTDARYGIYLAESSTVVRRALMAGHTPRSFLLAHRYLDSFADVLAAYPEVPVFTADDDLLAALTGFHLHRGALAAMERPAPRTLEAVTGKGTRRVIVAEGVNNHTNVGSIFRTGAALGWDAVILTPTAADPYYRRALRVSMGATFTLPFARVTHTVSAIQRLQAQGFTTIALELTDQAQDIGDPMWQHLDRLALVLGAEGPGITQPTLEAVDAHVQIPQHTGAIEHTGVDSLNVAHAASIAMWQLRAPSL